VLERTARGGDDFYGYKYNWIARVDVERCVILFTFLIIVLDYNIYMYRRYFYLYLDVRAVVAVGY